MAEGEREVFSAEGDACRFRLVGARGFERGAHVWTSVMVGVLRNDE